MDRYFIDFETRSDLDITSVGAMKYLHTPHSDIVCMSWAHNPPPYGNGKVKLWLPGQTVPFNVSEDGYDEECRVYSFNALFEYRVWNILGQKYNFGYLPINNMVDIQALCARYTFPQSLDRACKTLGVEDQKDPAGKKLMKKITLPPFKYTQEELHDFFRYCINDTSSMLAVLNALPSDHLSDVEQKVWEVTQHINIRGLPIDLDLVKRIWAVTNFYKDKELKKVPILTDGQVRNITQVQAVRDFCAEKGVDLPNLQADTVKAALEDDIPSEVEDLLLMRQEFGRSSIAKYKHLLERTYKGRIYDNLRYHRASPGRWGGMGFQAHNLPRDTVDNVDQVIADFRSTAILDKDPMYAAKALIRSCICAPEDRILGVADYKAIENILLAWVAGEDRILELHRKGLSEYKDFAADLYGLKYTDIQKGTTQYLVGKVVTLGAGYNLGANGLLSYAEGFGIDLTNSQAQEAINKYRNTHPKIRQMWYQLRDAAIGAILHPNERVTLPHYRLTSFICKKDRTGREWLVLTLPSSRSLYYADPEVKEDTFGLLPTHMGVNSKNKQWQRLKLIPGRITENIVQALARDVLAEAKIALEDYGFFTILSVHDEVVVELPLTDPEGDLLKMYELMCANPAWCTDLPLEAEGVITRRYYKI